MKTHFGERLECFRKLKRLTQPALAERAEIGLGSVSKYERLQDAAKVDYGTLRRIARALEIEVAQLTGEDSISMALPETVVASRESLKRFVQAAKPGARNASKLVRIQDDPAAPKTAEEWSDFSRLSLGLNAPKTPSGEHKRSHSKNRDVKKERGLSIVRRVPPGSEGKSRRRERAA